MEFNSGFKGLNHEQWRLGWKLCERPWVSYKENRI